MRRVHGRRGFHKRERQNLHDMVLDDVAQRAGSLVEPAAVLHSEALGHRDLDSLDIASVPDRFEDGVGEAEGQDVLDGLLAHVVVDPKNLVLVERRVHRIVELPRALQVPAVRLLDHEPGELAALTGVIAPSLARASATWANMSGMVAK